MITTTHCSSSIVVILLVLGIAVVTNAAPDFDGIPGFDGQPKFCPPYRCPRGQEPVPVWPLKMESTGCAGLGGGMQMMDTDVGKPNPLEICCDLKHACYQTCGTLRSSCDEDFIQCNKDTCGNITATHGDESQQSKDCDSKMKMNEILVKFDQQCTKFDQGQYGRCECIAKGDKVYEKRERVLRNFYKKFNKDSIDKVSSLMKKIDNSDRKMAILMYKLIKKYPQSIKKIKDPQQEMMERIMKQAQDGTLKTEDAKFDDDEEDNEDDDAVEDLGTDEL